MLGRHAEALREKTRALAMDPLSVVIQTDLGRMLYFARDYDQSLEHYRAALNMDPNFPSAHLWLAHVYQQKGMFEEAIAGRRDEALAVLTRLNVLSSQSYVSPYDIAMVHVGLGEHDEAFTWLEKAFEHRSLWLGYLNVEPQMDPLRPDQRFQGLLRRIGLLNVVGWESQVHPITPGPSAAEPPPK
jgi:tetratricopeptide (TPR) repeat protein